VAFVGVSPDPMKYAGRALSFLRKHGFRGPIFAVNPKYREVLGAPCVKDTSELPPDEIDLAFVAVSADRVPGVIEECGRKGIGAAIVASSGFREAGAEGARREEILRDAARKAGVRICGPNCIGSANLVDGVVASFGTVFEKDVPRGHVGVISQSGAFASNLVDALRRRGLGISYMVSSGNEADVTTGEYLRFVAGDERTRVVLVYMEGMRDPAAFLAAAGEALAAGKPVVLLKTGKTPAARRAILSHTGSLAGDQDVEAAAFERYGVVVVPSIDDMIEVAMLGARAPKAFAPGRGVGVVCIGSGGATSLASDLLEATGLGIPTLSEAATARLREIVPPFVTPQNPLDVAGYSFDDEADLADAVLDTFGADSAFDKLLAVVPGLPHVERCLQAVERVTTTSTKPVLTVFVGGPYTDEGIRLALAAGLPWSDDLERAGRAVAAATRFGEARARGPVAAPAPPPAPPPGSPITLTEYEAKQLLAPYGVATPFERFCRTLEDVEAAAQAIGYPVALKVQSASLPHKSDVGGVVLGIASEEALRRAFRTMREQLRDVVAEDAIAGYLVQEMVASGVEMFVGVKNDPTYGLTLLLGPGGIFVETMRDVAVGLLPTTAAEVQRLIARTALDRLFAGMRGRKPVHRAAVIDTVLALSRFAAEHGDSLVDLDINPLIADDTRAVAVDALIVRYPTAR
jgi:acyl-CoA synthetase (NDP forming)